jgi:hypothetical protein
MGDLTTQHMMEQGFGMGYKFILSLDKGKPWDIFWFSSPAVSDSRNLELRDCFVICEARKIYQTHEGRVPIILSFLLNLFLLFTDIGKNGHV